MKNHKFVTDLGVAAYLLMHQFKVIGKRGNAIYFECGDSEKEQFEDLVLDYMPPSEFYLFDACLVALKKINSFSASKDKYDHVLSLFDMGQAAYVLMKEYGNHSSGVKCLGKNHDRGIVFVVPKDKEEEFKTTAFEYLGSPFHTFDSCLMSLKKIGEYSPR